MQNILYKWKNPTFYLNKKQYDNKLIDIHQEDMYIMLEYFFERHHEFNDVMTS